MSDDAAPRPVLAGVRVLDFGQYIAGPAAAMLLADQGADVIRIDPPGGPRLQSPANAVWQRGKRSIVLDLKNSADVETARQLAARADVLIENFRPGVMDRLGLGEAELTALNPALVYCSIPGFSREDPRAAMPGWEHVIHAAAGAFSARTHALNADAGRQLLGDHDGVPIVTALPVASMYGAFLAALGVMLALVARQRDGHGQFIETPLYEACFMAVGSPSWMGMPGSPFVTSYECADGRWVTLIGYHAKFNRLLLKEAGVPEWEHEDWMGNVIARPFKTEPEKARQAVDKLAALFRTRTAREWQETLGLVFPCAESVPTWQWARSEQARRSGAIVEVPGEDGEVTLQPGLQVRLDRTPGSLGHPARAPDADRAAILAELASMPAKSGGSEQPDGRPPLAGLRMLDFGTILAGPACARMLAEAGVDVIKVDDPRGFGPGVDVSRGKRSILLRIDLAEGLEVIRRLAPRCDIVLQNFRMGVAERLGISHEVLSRDNPGQVHVSVSLYGREGPWAGRPGFENQAQAATGMLDRRGNGTPALEPLTVNDYGTAAMGAYGALLALYDRNQRAAAGLPPQGQHVDTALTYTATFLQSAWLHDPAERQIPRGPNVRGYTPLHRCYRAQDGWFALGAGEGDLPALATQPGLEGLCEVAPIHRAGWLETRFAGGTVARWIDAIRSAGAAAHAVLDVKAAMRDDYAVKRGLSLERAHPDGGRVHTIGPVIHLARTPLVPGQALRPSLEAEEIVAEAGLGDSFAELVEAGVVRVKLPKAR